MRHTEKKDLQRGSVVDPGSGFIADQDPVPAFQDNADDNQKFSNFTVDKKHLPYLTKNCSLFVPKPS
jgi:hypothetical protein